MVRTIAILCSQLMAAPILSEAVETRGRGPVDRAAFACRDISRSTVLQRVCYDDARHDLIVSVNGSYDRYCGVPADTVAALMGAPSMGSS